MSFFVLLEVSLSVLAMFTTFFAHHFFLRPVAGTAGCLPSSLSTFTSFLSFNHGGNVSRLKYLIRHMSAVSSGSDTVMAGQM